MAFITHQETHPTGLRLIIEQDDDPLNPRQRWDFVGTMICWHTHHLLGDAHRYQDPETYRRAVGHDILELPLYLYDHSGLTVQTTPFNCVWDSGQVGWIYVQRRKALAAFERKRLSPRLREAIFNRLRSEVALYDQWLRGDVWRTEIRDSSNNLLDGCSGYYGEDQAITEGRNMLDAAAARHRETRALLSAASVLQGQLERATCPESGE